MGRLVTAFTCCLFLVAAFLPMAAHATALRTWIDGQIKDPASSNLAGTYQTVQDPNKSYTISNGATLDAVDSSQDNIRFQSIVITANHNSVTGHIYFWGDYYPDPIGTVTFKLSASGTITRRVLNVTKAANGSTFSVSGWIQNPTDVSTLPVDPLAGSWSHISYPYNPNPPVYTLNVVCDTVATCGTIGYNTPTPGYQQGSVFGPRIMKGEIWFYLSKQNDKLTLNPGSGVSILTSGGGGSGGGNGGGITGDGGEGTGGSTCLRCCSCVPCRGEPPRHEFPDVLPIDKFIYKQVPVPILKEYLFEREREEKAPEK